MAAAVLDRIVSTVQLKLDNQDAQYLETIKTTIAQVWAYVARVGNWWFLDQPDPVPLTLTAGTRTYSIDKEDLGRLLYIGNAEGRRLWTYKSRFNWLAHQSEISDTSSVNIATGGGVFTIVGLARGRKYRIRLDRSPNTDGTVYVYYQEPGTLGNIDKCPAAWEMVIIHGVLSMVAPPRDINKYRWEALTYKEHEMFQELLRDMRFHEQAADNDEDELIMDPNTRDMVNDLNNLV